jgi:hypothetical protein
MKPVQLNYVNTNNQQKMARKTLRIVGTNWINVLGVFLSVFLYAIANILQDSPDYDVTAAVYAAVILVCFYGFLFWALFLIALLIFDLLLFTHAAKEHISLKLFTEWLLISIPFIYWIIKYEEYIFSAAIATFLITQILRRNCLRAILENGH